MSTAPATSNTTPPQRKSTTLRSRINSAFFGICISATVCCLGFLVILLWSVGREGASAIIEPKFGVELLAEADMPGLYVENVASDTSAAKAGIKRGDRLVKFDGQEVSNDFTVSALSEPVAVVVQRGDSEKSLEWQPEARRWFQRIRWNFIFGAPHSNPHRAGIWPVMMGSAAVCFICALFTLPIGVGAAVFLEEFKPKDHFLRLLHGFTQLNISNLAGVPSVVYGILGLMAFAYTFGLFGTVSDPALEVGAVLYDQFEAVDENLEAKRFASIITFPVSGRDAPETELVDGMTGYDFNGQPITVHVVAADADTDSLPLEEQAHTIRAGTSGSRAEDIDHWYYFRLPFGRGVLAGSLTLMLVILPIVIISSQEALRAVPSSLRDGALGLGATPLQTVWHVTLPAAVPGIMTGSILAMSRAIGEAAPLIIVAGAIMNRSSPPSSLMSGFSILPIQIFTWTEESDNAFHPLAAGSILLLLAMLLVFNGLAVFIRHKLQKPLS
jgi:phosphate transport system permease protein